MNNEEKEKIAQQFNNKKWSAGYHCTIYPTNNGFGFNGQLN